ncbi:MAG: DUF2752 domain-containing protein [Bacteroidota bacterium]
MPKTFGKLYHTIGPEPIIWLLAFLYLAIIDPATSTFSLCPLHTLGFQYCPGCGLGRSISFLLHGNIIASIDAHIVGIPATVILILRVCAVIQVGWQRRLILHQTNHQRSNHGQHSAIDAQS